MILMTAAMILLPASTEKYAETQVASVIESLPDTRPEILMAAIKKSPGWDGVNPEWMEFTGQAGTLIGGPVSELTKESGWTKEMADRRVSEALKQLADGFQVRVQPSHSPLRKTGVRFYITNPVIVGNLAFVEIDYVLTAAHTRVFEWRGRWVPVATLLGPVF